MGKQTIIRAPRNSDNPYFMMHRLTAQDDALSFEARGILAYLLSKPGDWQVNVTDLMQQGGCGRERINRILGELEEAGYLEREQARDEKARFSSTTFTLYERPQNQSMPENPLTENPSTENPDHTYNRALQSTDPSCPADKPPDDAPEKTKSGPIPAAIMNPLKDAIADTFGWSWDSMTKTEAGIIQKAARELAEVGATPADIPRLHALCKERFTQFKPRALVGVWSDYHKAHQSGEAVVPPSRPDGSYSPEDLERIKAIQASERVPGPPEPLRDVHGNVVKW